MTMRIEQINPGDLSYYDLYADLETGEVSQIPGNRPVDRRSVENIKRSMSEINALHLRPIVADTQGRIIDGQHRYTAATELGVPYWVLWVDPAQYSPEHLIALNTRAVNWHIIDYANFWMNQRTGDIADSYRIWAKLRREYPFVSSAVLVGLFEGNPINTQGCIKFKEGNLTLGPGGLKFVFDAISVFIKLNHITWRTHLESSVYGKQTFQRAIIQSVVMDTDFDRERFFKNLRKISHRFNELSRVTQMRDEIARIAAK